MDTSHLVIQRVEQKMNLRGRQPVCLWPNASEATSSRITRWCLDWFRPAFYHAPGFKEQPESIVFQEMYPYLVTLEQIMPWTDKPGLYALSWPPRWYLAGTDAL
ncbi:hypothetical protein N7520_004230 [Penicillium odoratum]|uniref:uncharacterized protein n=1 Tax=Penicillium odoratum TaxID=1167516 RepID=UPI002546E443|nr:uncharacterized protein N7520_004230 [Penicillium odoratum]KAJ5769671.1 hypothetical protein N7520_004230 [Penicillium odoratum]